MDSGPDDPPYIRVSALVYALIYNWIEDYDLDCLEEFWVQNNTIIKGTRISEEFAHFAQAEMKYGLEDQLWWLN